MVLSSNLTDHNYQPDCVSMMSNEIKIKDIIQRLQDNISTGDIAKSCFGVLAVLAKDVGSKAMILRDGMISLPLDDCPCLAIR